MTKRDAIEKLMKDADVAMLTTVDGSGTLKSRPMALVSWMNEEGDGLSFRFLTEARTEKTEAIEENAQVNVSITDLGTHRYLSVAGRASLHKGGKEVSEVWHDSFRKWFPDGDHTRDLCVLEVHGEEAEYWDYGGTRAHRSHVDLMGGGRPDYPDENDSDEIEAARAHMLNEADKRQDRPEIIHPLDETID